MATSVIMPQLGESVVDGTITKWLKQEGERVEEFESLLEVETAKVTSEIPSPAAGILLKIVVPQGQTVLAKTVLGWIGREGESVPDQPAGSAVVQQKAGEAPVDAPQETPKEKARPLGFISPVVNKLAQEYHLDLAQITGTGQGGRITRQDVMAYLEKDSPVGERKSEPAAWETPGSGDLFKPTGMLMPDPKQKEPLHAVSLPPKTGQTLPITPTRRAIADHMLLSKRTSAHVTTVMEADLSRVVADRAGNAALLAGDGVKLTYTPYFLIALARSLRKYPLLNSSWTDQGIILHADVNLGMAVSLKQEGLIVPVIRQADGLSLMGMARKVNDLAERARNNRLKPDEVTGGTFSLTNHGTAGSLFATPIINQPQVGILGVGMIQKRVVVIQDAIAIRPMVYLSLTFDHRVIDGSTADFFLAEVVQQLQTW